MAYNSTLPDNDWERLAIAQHFGLATCLLDWSYNPLVALYFACTDLPKTDGAVYCYAPEIFVNERVLDLKTVECNGAGFTPRSISPRILNQRAVFTVHLPAEREVQVKESAIFQGEPNLVKLVVPARLKSELLSLLDDYGINNVTLFPDLEGLSKHVNWVTEAIASTAKR